MLAYTWTFGSLMWGMLVFFFWVTLIWIFIAAVADIFRRHDLSGWGRAGWLALVFIVPLFGVLCYMIARPSTVDADTWVTSTSGNGYATTTGSNGSVADELAKLAKLHTDGDLDDSQYEDLKRRVVA